MDWVIFIFFSSLFWVGGFFPILLLEGISVCETEILDFWEMLFIVFWG